MLLLNGPMYFRESCNFYVQSVSDQISFTMPCAGAAAGANVGKCLYCRQSQNI